MKSTGQPTRATARDVRRKLNINPNLGARALALAQQRKQSFSELVEELLVRELTAPGASPYAPLDPPNTDTSAPRTGRK